MPHSTRRTIIDPRRWVMPRMRPSSFPVFTGLSRTSRPGSRARTTASARSTCRTTSMNSCFGSIAAACQWLHSSRCWASPRNTHPPPTRCCAQLNQPDRHYPTYGCRRGLSGSAAVAEARMLGTRSAPLGAEFGCRRRRSSGSRGWGGNWRREDRPSPHPLPSRVMSRWTSPMKSWPTLSAYVTEYINRSVSVVHFFILSSSAVFGAEVLQMTTASLVPPMLLPKQ